MNTLESPPPAALQPEPAACLEAARKACARIAPLWPLQDFVAVNPFLGLTELPFTGACELMQRLVPGGMQMTSDYYREKLAAGTLDDTDLAAALQLAPQVLSPQEAAAISDRTPARLRADLGRSREEEMILTVAEAADEQCGAAWSAAITESIGQFCAAYHDAGQSAWRLPWRGLSLYQAWREHAAVDATFELLGLPGHRDWVKALPAEAGAALTALLPEFRLGDGLTDFLHKQLLTIRGWAGYVQYRVREAGGRDQAGASLLDLLAIRVALDAAVLRKVESPAFREFWPAHSEAGSGAVLDRFLWQLADEHAWQRHLQARLKPASRPESERAVGRPAVQAVFCIDVRSEVFRRALESASPRVATLGFAGFFGLPIESVPFGQPQAVAQCPVLLRPKYRVRETLPGAGPAEERRALRRTGQRRRIGQAWNAFKSSAISCFSFVETAGLGFGVQLFRSTFAPGTPRKTPTCRPCLAPDEAGYGGIPPADRIGLARGILRHMGLTRDFARLVLLCGHGSTTTNNPYAAALDCGACGGHAGDTNARVAAAILNDPAVRAALTEDGVVIPGDTWFLAGLHDTTTDEVSLFDLDRVPGELRSDVEELKVWLVHAGQRARRERAALLGLDPHAAGLDPLVIGRSRDWAQVRPEWGLAGNAAFIAAPRARTQGVDLGGRIFLHNYDHRADTDNSTLELIMCAPMVVANWINLQYYASTVNNAVFGSGNKVIHNVVGTLGVCLGNGGDLQTGLPLQSVQDGTRWIHEPLRLHVLLEAPRDRIEAVLAKHPEVRQLADHGWLLLFALEDEGQSWHRYLPGGRWERQG